MGKNVPFWLDLFFFSHRCFLTPVSQFTSQLHSVTHSESLSAKEVFEQEYFLQLPDSSGESSVILCEIDWVGSGRRRPLGEKGAHYDEKRSWEQESEEEEKSAAMCVCVCVCVCVCCLLPALILSETDTADETFSILTVLV